MIVDWDMFEGDSTFIEGEIAKLYEIYFHSDEDGTYTTYRADLIDPNNVRIIHRDIIVKPNDIIKENQDTDILYIKRWEKVI